MNEIWSDEIYRQLSEEYEKVLSNTSLATLAISEKKQPFKVKSYGELFEAVTVAASIKDTAGCFEIKSTNFDRLAKLYTEIMKDSVPEVASVPYDIKTQVYLIELLMKIYLKYEKTEHSSTILTIILSEITALGVLNGK